MHAIHAVCTVHTMLVHQVHTTHTPYIWSTRHIQYQQYRNMLSMQHKPYIAQFPIDVHIDIHWYTSSSMGVQGDPWICISILGYPGRSTKILGYVWISMYIHRYSLISMYIQEDACMCTHHQPYTIINHLGGRLFVTTWSAIWLPRISTRPVSKICLCASLQISRLSDFVWSLVLQCFYWLPSLCWEKVWVAKHHLGAADPSKSDLLRFMFEWFPEISKSWGRIV